MATSSSIAKLSPRLQSVFGLLSVEDDTKIRIILGEINKILLEFAQHFGLNRAGWEGTGLDLVWNPSGQVQISSFIGAGLDGNRCADFIVSLQPGWVYSDFPSEQIWEIEAQIYADCQHKIDHWSMHLVHDLPTVHKTNPIDAVETLRDMTAELVQLGKEKPLEFWLNLAGTDEE